MAPGQADSQVRFGHSALRPSEETETCLHAISRCSAGQEFDGLSTSPTSFSASLCRPWVARRERRPGFRLGSIHSDHCGSHPISRTSIREVSSKKPDGLEMGGSAGRWGRCTASWAFHRRAAHRSSQAVPTAGWRSFSPRRNADSRSAPCTMVERRSVGLFGSSSLVDR